MTLEAGDYRWVKLPGRPAFWLRVSYEDANWTLGREVDAKGELVVDQDGADRQHTLLRRTTLMRTATMTMWGLEVWRP